jgi:hypothetical protein
VLLPLTGTVVLLADVFRLAGGLLQAAAPLDGLVELPVENCWLPPVEYCWPFPQAWVELFVLPMVFAWPAPAAPFDTTVPVPEVVVFCVIGSVGPLAVATLFLLPPQHSQPARVMPATMMPAHAIRFFQPIEYPLPARKKVYARPATLRSEPPAAVVVRLA